MKEQGQYLGFDPNPMPKIDINLSQGLLSLAKDNQTTIATVGGAALFLGTTAFDTQNSMDSHLKLKLWIGGIGSVLATAKEIREASQGGSKMQILTNFIAGFAAGFTAPDIIRYLDNREPYDFNKLLTTSAFAISSFYILKSTNLHLLLGQNIKGRVDNWNNKSKIEVQAHKLNEQIKASKKFGSGGNSAFNDLVRKGFPTGVISKLQNMDPSERRKVLEDMIKEGQSNEEQQK